MSALETSKAIESAEFEGKREFKLPEGATIIKNSHTISVREIENGFILRKSYDIKWMLGVRIFFILTMGILGVIVHVLGRCEPLSIIITFLLLRSW